MDPWQPFRHVYAEYTGIEVKQFRETLLQHMSNVKKSVAKITHHKRLYDRRVNKRQMLKQESKVDLGKALDVGLVVTESSGTEFGKQDTSSRSGNDVNADDANIKPVYDEEPMAEIQEKVFAIAALKNELRKLKGNSVDTKFAKSSVLGKPILQPLRKQPVERESVSAKPHYVIASSEYRHTSKNMSRSKPRFSSNDMVHNHYIEEAKKKTQERIMNSKLSVMPSRPQSTTSGSKPKPRSDNQTSRSLPVSKSRKLFDSCTSKVDSEPPHDSNVGISKIHEWKQTLDLNADHVSSDPAPQCPTTALEQRQFKSLFPKSTNVPLADETVTTSLNELDMLFSSMFDEYFNGAPTVVSKPFVVFTADGSDKRHQQNTTSSTSKTVAADLSPLII
ncbi:hypothetical protein Tco_1490894 [Tanacetum coccineum]